MPTTDQVRKDEIIFKQIQQRQNKEYQQVLLELSRTSWNDCNYSKAVKQQAMYSAIQTIPEYRIRDIFKQLAIMFGEEIEIQEEIFNVEEEFKAKMICKMDETDDEDVVIQSSSKRAKNNDGDFDMSISSLDTTLNSTRGAKKSKSLKIMKEPEEPLENYRKIIRKIEKVTF